nr:MAG TPA: hypothetical protein [Caudoviricetes sp.]
MDKKELRRHLGTIAHAMDSQWRIMRWKDVDDRARGVAAGQYQGMTFALSALGGDWLRDDNYRHRVFLMGESSRDTDEYGSEEV